MNWCFSSVEKKVKMVLFTVRSLGTKLYQMKYSVVSRKVYWKVVGKEETMWERT